jgi:hypothetical protein
MTRTVKRGSSLAIAIGVASGTVVLAILAAVAWAAGEPNFARGVLQGGAFGIAGAVTLIVLARTRFATAEARLVAGVADERERRLATRALAIAAVAMYVAAVAASIATMFGLEPEASLAIIMFTGLIAAATAFAVAVRRD